MASSNGWSFRSASRPASMVTPPAVEDPEVAAAKARAKARWDRWLAAHPEAARRLVAAHIAGPAKWSQTFDQLWSQAMAAPENENHHSTGTAVEAINANRDRHRVC
jgi:hypothetical protein